MQRFKIMWIVKGVPLGLVIFIVGGIAYTGILVGIAMYRFAHKAGGIAGGNWHVHYPVLWGALLVAVAIGIWIMRLRTT